MKRLIHFLLIAAVLVIAGCGGGGEDSKGSLRVTNEAGNSIMYLYVSPANVDSWGVDQLGQYTIQPYGSFTLNNITPGQYDLQVVMSSGSRYTLYNFQVIAGQTTEVYNPSYNYKQIEGQNVVAPKPGVITDVKDATADLVLSANQGELKNR